MRHKFVSLLILGLIGSEPLLAAEESEKMQSPAAFQAIVDCRGVADDAARLRCFDANVAKLEQATVSGEVIVTDKAKIREARRGLFGFKLPSLNIFGGGNEAGQDDQSIEEIETTITSVRGFGYGQWRFTLADGAVWEQTDTTRMVLDPKSGSKIRIKQAALGSFKAHIDGQKPVRVRRVE